MRNYEMVLQALKSGEVKTMVDLKQELPGLEHWNMHKYVARAKYLAGAEIELMKAGVVIKTARAKDAETLRLVNADKFKTWKPESKTGGPLFRKVNPKTKKAVKAVAKPKVVKAKAQKPLVVPTVSEAAPVVVSSESKVDVASIQEMIKAELAATAPKGGVKKAAALPRGPEKAKVKRVSEEVTSVKNAEDLLEIPDFLRIQTDKSPKLVEE